jgi:serine/threonine protein kinase
MNERDIFIAALQIESRAERQAYLDGACGINEPLRRRVKALLVTHDRAGGFLREPALGPQAAALLDNAARAQPAEGVSAPTDRDREKALETQAEAAVSEPPSLGFLAPPQEPDELGRLGHYRVLRLLGQGGMGIVFLADDTRLQRPVALKVMRPELAADSDGRQRFLREARAAAQVRSEHVAAIYHVDQEGDLPYLVMELLHGRSLADVLEQGGRLPLGLCLKVARETAEGLAAAHASGLIHRDVKPGNIFLVSGGVVSGEWSPSDSAHGSRADSDRSPLTTHRSPTAKLLDFGLARARTGPRITQRHVILGTPAYMAPEQAAGQALDARCDLFSLGAVLYHMLTGQRPFTGQDVMAVLSSLANVTPPPVGSLVPALPAGVAEVVDRLLAKDPAARPASAAEVAGVLLALEQDAAALAPSASQMLEPSDAQAKPPRARRRRRLALVGAMVLAGLVIGLVVAVRAGAFRGRSDGGGPPADPAPSPPPTPSAADPRGPAKKPPEAAPVAPFALIGHGFQVQALAFTTDGKTLVSAEYWGGMVKFWDMDRREPRFEMSAVPGGQLQCLALDPQQRWLAVGPMSPPGQVHPGIRLFRFGEPLMAGLLKGHADRVLQLAFLKDGRTLLSTGYDGPIRRWNVEEQKEVEPPLRASGPRLDCLNVWENGPRGLRLALAGDDPARSPHNFASLDDVVLQRFPYGPGIAVFSPDGTRLACSKQERIARAKDSCVALWDLSGKNPASLGELTEAPLARGLTFTPDGKHVVVMSREFTRIYETASGKPVAHVDHADVVALAVSPDGRWLAVGTLKGPIRVWHLPTLLAPPG